MTDLLGLFHQLVRFETELWNAVDAVTSRFILGLLATV
jgi:hypothetical protein